MQTVGGLIGLGVVYFCVFAFIYTGICGLTGRPIHIPGRGGSPGVTATGVSARIGGAFFLIVGLFMAILFTRHLVGTLRGGT